MSSTPDRRTRVVTAVGILAVIVAGAFAVSANLGILSASSEQKVGALAAAGDLVPTTGANTTPATTPASTAPAPASPPATQRYLVDAAGSIILRDADPIVVDHVEVNPGWSWRPDDSRGPGVTIELSDGSRTLHFTASRAAGGTLAATLDEAPTAPASTSATTTPTPAHDEHEHEEHEGRDDDD
jgi:hypothetical protein